MDNLVEIKKILGITDTSKDAVITSLQNNIVGAIKLYIGETSVPNELNFIVTEATIARFNILGSEGLSQESIDIVSQTFISDVLDTYKPYLDAYVSRNSTTSNKKLKMI